MALILVNTHTNTHTHTTHTHDVILWSISYGMCKWEGLCLCCLYCDKYTCMYTHEASVTSTVDK